ncbi:MAG: hypothetical protein EPO24_05965 [Bacteroidetes bacterium]|nr:MAG: hypothetical protein EPO24_05965 [Bacteroidota bacterium]
MTDHNLTDTLINEISNLPITEQRLVLEFARSFHLSIQKGVSGDEMSKRSYGFQEQDLIEMEQAILEGCEEIEHNEW